MGYDSDFYTTRRTYSRPVVTSYTYSKREIPWEKVPFVARPSLIADPITIFGTRRSASREKQLTHLEKIKREPIQPSAAVLAQPIKYYISARDRTRQKVLSLTRRNAESRERNCTSNVSYGPRNNVEKTKSIELQNLMGQQQQRRKFVPLNQTPRYRVETVAEPTRTRRANEYSYSYSTAAQSRTNSSDPYTSSYSRPERSSTSTTVERSTKYGPAGDYSYSSSRSTSGGGPSGYSYSSSTSGRLPYGTTYRHYSYRV